MNRTFTIETTTDTLTADAKEPAKAVFIVINTASGPVRGLATAKAQGDTKLEWLSIAGETERDFGRGDKERFTVNFDAASAPAGKYPFRLDVASALNPEEDFTEGPTVTVEIAAKPITDEPKTFPKWIIPVIAGIVLLVGAFVAWRMFREDKPPENPPVALYKLPDVEDVGEDKAKQRLEGECVTSVPCVVVEVNRVFDDKVAEGRTVRTEPAAGTAVELGSKVVLVTSRGPSRVPSVTNQTGDAARKILETMCQQVGCRVETSNSPHDTIAAGMAIGTVPGENEALTSSTTVTLVISSGQELKSVGTYVGMQQQAAQNQVVTDGFTVGQVSFGIVRDHRTGAPPVIPGTVFRQEPAARTMRPKGSKIDLWIVQAP